MSDKKPQKPLTKRQLDFCKYRYEDKLTDEQIAATLGVNRSTLYDWDKKPAVQAEIRRLGKADTQKAVRFFERNSLRAAQATVKLTETRTVKDDKGSVIGQDFVQTGEVVRKAAADILQGVGLKVKGIAEDGADIMGNVHIYIPDNGRDKEKDAGDSK